MQLRHHGAVSLRTGFATQATNIVWCWFLLGEVPDQVNTRLPVIVPLVLSVFSNYSSCLKFTTPPPPHPNLNIILPKPIEHIKGYYMLQSTQVTAGSYDHLLIQVPVPCWRVCSRAPLRKAGLRDADLVEVRLSLEETFLTPTPTS